MNDGNGTQDRTRYREISTGRVVEILTRATNLEDHAETVVFEDEDGRMFVCPADRFFQLHG